MMTSLLFALVLSGKLADGWKGQAYGADHPYLTTPPAQDCTPNPEPGVRWVCQQTIGEKTYPVSYFIDADTKLFYGVFINCSDYASCAALKATLDAGWGSCTPKSGSRGALADCVWSDGAVMGAWEFNDYGNFGYALSTHRPSYVAVKAAEAERARSAANDL